MRRETFYKLYFRLQALIVPCLRNSQEVYKERLFEHVDSETRWLDLGCGHNIYPDWMQSRDGELAALSSTAALLVGIDADEAGLSKNTVVENRLAGYIENLPFPDNAFSLLTANVVVEHVRDPSLVLAEAYRVLEPGGMLILLTPNARSYSTRAAGMIPQKIKVKLLGFLEDRQEGDIFPAYYRLNTTQAIELLARNAGFEIDELRPLETWAKTVMLGPFVIVELLLMRLLRTRPLCRYQHDLIAVLRRPEGAEVERPRYET
jgi:ubiquinone/menaquinone biosynthesis C-methylase UbiE